MTGGEKRCPGEVVPNAEPLGVATAGGCDPLLYVDNPLGVPPVRGDTVAVGILDVALGVAGGFGDVAAALADTGIREGDALGRGVSALGVLGGSLR